MNSPRNEIEEKYPDSMKFYNRRIEQAAGEPGKATAYGSKKSRLMRYYTAARMPFMDNDKWEGSSLLDVGCGPGHFRDWLAKEEISPKTYNGVDPNKGMIDLAEKRGVENVRHMDVFGVEGQFDWVVANCIFASAFSDRWVDNLDVFKKTVFKMWELCKYGMCFDVTHGESEGIVRDADGEIGYNELTFSVPFVYGLLRELGARIVIDKSSSTRYFVVYMFKRPQLFDRLTEADL